MSVTSEAVSKLELDEEKRIFDLLEAKYTEADGVERVLSEKVLRRAGVILQSKLEELSLTDEPPRFGVRFVVRSMRKYLIGIQFQNEFLKKHYAEELTDYLSDKLGTRLVIDGKKFLAVPNADHQEMRVQLSFD